ncbi:N-acylneuraminate cytidylyltransferase isoform X2 [Sitodiplosis mosellana]|uniref:N-acylneuraminate cytidylyltransferase isoform X2 n=1 Tax=Sitodiplosis mosellana TaxID=263140 RepID=UPI002443F6FA|nr:N-acylneuraminate cytidylyltransferase isoform X2 [Sitodiplosis mosellana]
MLSVWQRHGKMNCVMNKKLCVHFSVVLLSITVVNTFLTEQELANDSEGIVALILARGGSKGIPYKNIAKIAGVSLLGRALRVIHNCRNCFQEVWVSTDNEMIAKEARRYNANVHYRSEHSARDEATSIESIQEFLGGHSHVHNIALIQCTSVFIYEYYLERAANIFNRQPDIDCAFSVQRSWKLRWQQVANSNRLKAINFDPKKRPRRQDWAGELIETGMFYFMRRNLVENQGLLQNDGCKFVEIDGKHALEIDDPFQLAIANVLIKDN